MYQVRGIRMLHRFFVVTSLFFSLFSWQERVTQYEHVVFLWRFDRYFVC